MKKILYTALIALLAISCTKNITEESVNKEAPKNVVAVNMTVPVAVEADTKASFDGENRVVFSSTDAFYAAIASKDAPSTALVVETSKDWYGDLEYSYYQKFSLVSPTEEPVFKGTFYILETDFVENGEYNFYGVFPYSAVNYLSGKDLSKWRVVLKNSQKQTQDSWDSSCNVMLAEPGTISTSATDDYKYNQTFKDYEASYTGETVAFAHLFGYCKMNFAGIPEEYASETVKSITIEAIGEKKDITGTYEIDITKQVDEIVPVAKTTNSKITLTCDNSVAISDYTAWFVANPGIYDVKITVATGAADFVFERSGLEIERSKIAAPTVNLKEIDQTVDHSVDLTGSGTPELWTTGAFTYSSTISSSYKSRTWGVGEKKMNFTILFEGEENASNYASYNGNSTDGYVQIIAQNSIKSGAVILTSEAAFKGVEAVHMSLGLYTEGAIADYTLSLVDGANTYELGKYTINGSSSYYGQDYSFTNNTDVKKGKLVLRVDNLRGEFSGQARPTLGLLTINPKPIINLASPSLSIEKTATQSTVGCEVLLNTADVTVSVDSEASSWLSASYADNLLTYTATENTGKKREGTITIKTTGVGGETTANLVVKQASAVAKTFTLTLTSEDLKNAANAKIAELNEAGTTIGQYSSYEVSLSKNATSSDASTKNVTMVFPKVVLYSTVGDETVFKVNGAITTAEELGEVQSVKFTSAEKGGTSTWSYTVVSFSIDGTTWVKNVASQISVEGTTAPYTTTVTNDNSDYLWFKIEPSAAKDMDSIEVVFVADAD